MTEQHVYRIHTHELHASGRRAFIIIATEHPTLEELARDLRRGPLVVRRLWTHASLTETGVMDIYGDRELMITGAMVHTADTPSEWRYVDSRLDTDDEITDATAPSALLPRPPRAVDDEAVLSEAGVSQS